MWGHTTFVGGEPRSSERGFSLWAYSYTGNYIHAILRFLGTLMIMKRLACLVAALAIVFSIEGPHAGAQPTDEPSPDQPSSESQESSVGDQTSDPAPEAPEPLPDAEPPTIPVPETIPEPEPEVPTIPEVEEEEPSTPPVQEEEPQAQPDRLEALAEVIRKLKLSPHFTTPVISRAPVGVPSSSCHSVRSSRKAVPGGTSPAASSRVSC